MKNIKSLFIFALVFFTTILPAQPDSAIKGLIMKIQKIDMNTYGVFVKPEGIAPTERTVAGSGQVTIVAPVDFTYTNLENYGGSWVENARVNAPEEAMDKAYVSFGFVTDFPKINLIPHAETLLFTFRTDEVFDGTLSLIDNYNDPFMVPNSYGTNPGNDLGIIDTGNRKGLLYYAYGGNYYDETVQAIFTNSKTENSQGVATGMLTAVELE